MLCGALVILMIAGILMIFMPYNKYAVIAYGSAGALIFSMYIVYDTQVSRHAWRNLNHVMVRLLKPSCIRYFVCS